MQQIATSPNCCLSFAGFTPRQVKGLDSCMFTVECSLSRREDDENIRKQWDVSDKLVDEDLNNISPQGSFLQRGFFITTLLAYCNSLTPRIWIVEQQQQSSALSPSPRAWGGGGAGWGTEDKNVSGPCLSPWNRRSQPSPRNLTVESATDSCESELSWCDTTTITA